MNASPTWYYCMVKIMLLCYIKYQKDIGWVRQNTTLYYGVGCPKGTTYFGPLL